MKKLSVLIFILTFLILFSSCTVSKSDGGTNKNDESQIFNTDNIKSITFYSYYGQENGIRVPDEDMQAITNWLSTFVIDKEVDEPLPPGTNNYYVEIEYSDGTKVKEGIDVVEINDTAYYIKHAALPDCFEKIVSQISE